MNGIDPDDPSRDWLAYQGRYVNVTFMLEIGGTEYLVTIHEGRLARILPGPHVMPCWTFALVASDDTWQRFWSTTPQPRFHDLMAMVKFKTLKINGDQTVFMRNLLYFKELIRRLGSRIHAS